MIDKMNYVKSNLDDLITGIQWEPRGHDDIYLTIITPPVHPEANFGVVYRGPYKYYFMCGHGTIGTVTVAIETGIVKACEPFTNVVLDTPSGLVSVKARVENGSVKSVTLRNVPSFLYKKDVFVEIPEIGKVRGDISFGGDFYYLTESSELGIDLDTIQIEKLMQIGSIIKDAVNKSISVSHPVIKEAHEIQGTIINGPPTNPKADCRNIGVGGTHIDKSPCGTGTCAKMAALYGRGKLKKGDILCH
jgi:proline racemase